jgi:hypothetical protein
MVRVIETAAEEIRGAAPPPWMPRMPGSVAAPDGKTPAGLAKIKTANRHCRLRALSIPHLHKANARG